MFSWLSNWWSDPNIKYGPARNAPDNILQMVLLGQNQFINVTEEEIINTKSKLKKTEINANPPISEYKKNSPMYELTEIFKNGIKSHLRKCIINEKKEELNVNSESESNESDNEW